MGAEWTRRVPPEWLNDLAERLERARCWHLGDKAFGRGTSSKWWDLSPGDVDEAIVRLRELARDNPIEENDNAR